MGNQVISRNTSIITSMLDNLFLLLTSVYLFYQETTITTFYLAYPIGFIDGLLLCMTLVALIKLMVIGPRHWQTWAGLGIAIIYYLVYKADGYQFLLFLAVMTIGLIGIDYRKVLKIYLLVNGTVLCVAVVSSFTGIIQNLVYMRNGARSAWGIVYPTDFASAVLFFLILLWVTWDKCPDGIFSFLTIVFIFFSKYITRSTTCFLCGIVLLCIIAYCMVERYLRLDSRGKVVGLLINKLLIFSFALFAMVFFAFMLLYYKGSIVGAWLNRLLSDRLRLSIEAWKLHGLRMFGTPFEQIGSGGSVFPNIGYNFVDSSFPLILVRYGWVLFSVLCVMWGVTAFRAIHFGNRRLALAMGLIAFHAFSEHHFMDTNYNILLVLSLANFDYKPIKRSNKEKQICYISSGLTVVLIAGLGVAALPDAFSWLKTVFQVKGVGIYGNHNVEWFDFWMVVLGVAACLSVVISVFHIINAFISHKNMNKVLPAWFLLFLCILYAGRLFIASNQVISKGMIEQEKLIQSDQKALEVAIATASGKVYSDQYPAIYHRSFPEISYSVISGEDFSRLGRTTVLTDNSKELNTYIASGFLYSRISELHSIYTNDPSVILGLQNAGFHLTGYYNNTNEVDLKDSAQLNNLSYSQQNGLQLNGNRYSLIYGPYYDLYAGQYTVTYELELPKETPLTGELVCLLRVSAFWGQSIITYKYIYRSDFVQGDGKLVVSLPFYIQSSKGVEFLAFVEEGEEVYIKKIQWGRSPDYDVHVTYDEKHRIVKGEVYSIEGQAIVTEDGYHAYGYEYDKEGRICAYLFYDNDNNLTMRNDGYAVKRCLYNDRGLVVKEEFYDPNGQLVELANGSAMVEREYDKYDNLVCVRYYNVYGEETIIYSGYMEKHFCYDELNRVIREEYYGLGGERIKNIDGYAIASLEYDAEGNVSAKKYYDERGVLALNRDGYAEKLLYYNENKQLVREEYYGIDSQLTTTAGGFSAREIEYNIDGEVATERYYDKEGYLIRIQ